MSDRPLESWRARAAVSEALDVFNSSYMQDVWTKALARRESDPEGAVTSARTLLESLCKHILESAGKEYRDGAPLPELYRATAQVLDIAPTEDTAPIFTTVFSACSEIVKGVGVLRNHLSDSHGRGPFGTMPDWRHAELAVNLSGAMATYLAAVWKGRQRTVGDVVRQFLDTAEKTKPLGESHRATLEVIARHSIADVIVSRLRRSDVIGLCEDLRDKGLKPATINQYVVFLRGSLGDQYADVIDEAAVAARQMNLIGKSQSRARRTNHAEFDALIAHFQDQAKQKRTKIPMDEITEFAVWSGLPIGKICSLQWKDVDFEKRTCKLPNRKTAIPLLEKAWNIVEARGKRGLAAKDDRIFPYVPKSASKRYIDAKNELSKAFPSLADSRLNDLRYEAINRLLEKGHPPHIVALATSTAVAKVMKIYEGAQTV